MATNDSETMMEIEDTQASSSSRIAIENLILPKGVWLTIPRKLKKVISQSNTPLWAAIYKKNENLFQHSSLCTTPTELRNFHYVIKTMAEYKIKLKVEQLIILISTSESLTKDDFYVNVKRLKKFNSLKKIILTSTSFVDEVKKNTFISQMKSLLNLHELIIECVFADNVALEKLKMPNNAELAAAENEKRKRDEEGSTSSSSTSRCSKKRKRLSDSDAQSEAHLLTQVQKLRELHEEQTMKIKELQKRNAAQERKYHKLERENYDLRERLTKFIENSPTQKLPPFSQIEYFSTLHSASIERSQFFGYGGTFFECHQRAETVSPLSLPDSRMNAGPVTKLSSDAMQGAAAQDSSMEMEDEAFNRNGSPYPFGTKPK